MQVEKDPPRLEANPLTNSLSNSTWELFEVKARSVGFTVERTEIWFLGEECGCGCKYLVLSGCSIMAHCKTVKQVAQAIAHERAGLKPFIREKQPEQATYGGKQLSLI